MFSICPRFMVSMKWSRCITCSQAITISNAIEDFVVNSDDNEQGFLIDFFFLRRFYSFQFLNHPNYQLPAAHITI